MGDDYEGVYFTQLCDVIESPQAPDVALYSNVLWHLHQSEFVPVLNSDKNRVQDALDFRARYIDDDVTPVGIFELMVSLAARIESDTMGGTSDRNRTVDWFWGMLASLGLLNMTNDVYDERDVDRILRIFLGRKYARNGRGGLFVISDDSVDLREEEIWYQAAYYLNEVLRSEGVLEP